MLPALYTLADEYIGAAQYLQNLDLDEQIDDTSLVDLDGCWIGQRIVVPNDLDESATAWGQWDRPSGTDRRR